MNFSISNKTVFAGEMSQVLTSRDFLRMVKRNPNKIKSSKFVPPKLGRDNDFGKFIVKLK